MAESKVIVLSGRKQGGKTTCRNFLVGHMMQQAGITEVFDITDKGELLIQAKQTSANGQTEEGMALLDLDRTDADFLHYAMNRIWPFIKSYSFADTLKGIAIQVFGLSYSQCYGTNEEKNTLTNIKWSNIAFALSQETINKLKSPTHQEHPTQKGVLVTIPPRFDGYLTAREFLQVFGTEVCRKIYGDCWVDACFRQIIADNPTLAVITDARFPNEIEASLQRKATIIRFTRAPFKGQDEHESETALDIWDNNSDLRSKFTIYCQNENMSVHQQNIYIMNELARLGLIKVEV